MNRIFITLLTALLVIGFAETVLAGDHDANKSEGAHAECAHAAGEACPHADKSEEDSATQCTRHAEGTHAHGEVCPHANKSEEDSATQCTRHAEGEACSRGEHEKSGDEPAVNG